MSDVACRSFVVSQRALHTVSLRSPGATAIAFYRSASDRIAAAIAFSPARLAPDDSPEFLTCRAPRSVRDRRDPPRSPLVALLLAFLGARLSRRGRARRAAPDAHSAATRAPPRGSSSALLVPCRSRARAQIRHAHRPHARRRGRHEPAARGPLPDPRPSRRTATRAFGGASARRRDRGSRPARMKISAASASEPGGRRLNAVPSSSSARRRDRHAGGSVRRRSRPERVRRDGMWNGTCRIARRQPRAHRRACEETVRTIYVRAPTRQRMVAVHLDCVAALQATCLRSASGSSSTATTDRRGRRPRRRRTRAPTAS